MSSINNTSLIHFEETEETITVSMLGPDSTKPVLQTYRKHMIPSRFQTAANADYYLMTRQRAEDILRQRNTDYQIVENKVAFDHACVIRERMKATDACYFILDENKDPEPVRSIDVLLEWLQPHLDWKVLGFDIVGTLIISTQFFGTWTCIYETMVFDRQEENREWGSPHKQFTRRYETYEIAMQGHKEVVEQCKQGAVKAHE